LLIEAVPFGQDGIPPAAGEAANIKCYVLNGMLHTKGGIEVFIPFFNLFTLNKPKAVMVCIKVLLSCKP